MKINKSKIKKWNFKKRLSEIKIRLDFLKNSNLSLDEDASDCFDEVNQIVKYWMSHMKDTSKINPVISKKEQNLWKK